MFSKKSGRKMGETELMRAVAAQDVPLTAALVQSGADTEARDRYCQNVLYYAFPVLFLNRDGASASFTSQEAPTVEILRELLVGGVNINAALDGDGCSALVTAVCMGWGEVVTLLLDNSADVDEAAMAKNEGSLSSGAARHRHSDTYTIQSAVGATTSDTGPSSSANIVMPSDTATLSASENKISDSNNDNPPPHFLDVDMLLSHNNSSSAVVNNALSADNSAPLTINIPPVDHSIINENGNDAFVTDTNADSVSDVHSSIVSPDAVVFNVDEDFIFKIKEPTDAYHQFIFSKGCSHSVSPLLCAVMQNRQALVYKLISAGASPSSLSFGTFWRASGSSVCSSCDVKVTPLHMAAYMGNLQVTYDLLMLLNSKSERQCGKLRSSCEKGDNTCDVNGNGERASENKDCDSNDSRTDDPCDNKSFDDNLDDNNNNDSQYFAHMTPLWLALLQGHVRIVKLFLSLGRPLSVVSHFGSGLQVCLQEGHKPLALMLLRAGYDLNDDLEWIEDGDYPCSDSEVIAHIEALVNQPRPLLDLSASSLRLKFGLKLDDYLNEVGAPKKVKGIVNFNDLSPASWQEGMFYKL